MLTRLVGRLDAIEGSAAVVTPPPGGMSYQVMLPAYLVEQLAERVGQPVTLHTRQYLEAQGQGSSFVPRLVGFASVEDRRFFELFTTVKGLGARRALRAMAQPPAMIAAAIAARDTQALQQLPEIGKRLAETMVAELNGKVSSYLLDGIGHVEAKPTSPRATSAREAVATLVALGETQGDAQRKVDTALSRDADLATTEQIVASAFGG